jgi:LmbE family N-acetylglucosaminyl deacetylase
MQRLIPIFLFCFLMAAPATAQSPAASPLAPALLPPDDRYKADVLVIVAHPDDDVLIGGYLARIALDEHKRVAFIYCTSGDGGGNDVGNEAGAALGQLRILEARRALASLGIENLWFLPGHDTPGQNVLRSLDHWNHGLALDEIVRLVRITRPEVILTWLPDPVAGENHEDHQASSVLATEAFDLAADPTWFPEQVSPPRDRTGMNNLTEGLLPWQPKKLYFFTDAFENFSAYWHDPAQLPNYRKNILDGTGPTYETTTVSPSRHVSYAQLEAVQQVFYRTQEGALGEQAIAANDFKNFAYPVRLILGKSLVGGSFTGDVFEGISANAVPFAPVRGYQPDSPAPLTFEIGDPWHFYSLFWKAHSLDRLANLLPEPELASRSGDQLNIPLLACNHTPEPVEFALTPTLPPGWKDDSSFSRYPVRSGECYPILAQVSSSSAAAWGWQQIAWTVASGSQQLGSVRLRVYLGNSGGLPQ